MVTWLPSLISPSKSIPHPPLLLMVSSMVLSLMVIVLSSISSAKFMPSSSLPVMMLSVMVTLTAPRVGVQVSAE